MEKIPFFSPPTGLHEEVDRRVSQNSLGEMTKLGSKTALNRRVRDFILKCLILAILLFFFFSLFNVLTGVNFEDLSNHSGEITKCDPCRKSVFLNQ